MTGASDGMNYAPRGKARPVVEPGAFTFAAAFLEHGHIHGQCNGLIEAGAGLRWVYDPDPTKVEAFRKVHPGVRAARSFDEVLDDPAVRLVAAAAVPCERAAIGMQVMRAGKDYFTDKAPFTSLDQLAQVRRVVEETRRRYAVYFSERLHVECAIRAGELIEQGAIGRVIQIIGLGPHRLSAASRPDWFWSKAATGGILCDLASHQCEQFLHYAGAATGRVNFARVANVCHPEHPEFEDFGEASVTLDNGVSCYLRVDWFTPDGLRTWGDGRTIILGTEGYIELRKYVDVTTDAGPDQLILVDSRGEHRQSLRGQVGFPYFSQLILDCLHGTDRAMPQEHVFAAAELSLRAQQCADTSRDARPDKEHAFCRT